MSPQDPLRPFLWTSPLAGNITRMYAQRRRVVSALRTRALAKGVPLCADRARREAEAAERVPAGPGGSLRGRRSARAPVRGQPRRPACRTPRASCFVSRRFVVCAQFCAARFACVFLLAVSHESLFEFSPVDASSARFCAILLVLVMTGGARASAMLREATAELGAEECQKPRLAKPHRPAHAQGRARAGGALLPPRLQLSLSWELP